jgi:hypothetical protein
VCCHCWAAQYHCIARLRARGVLGKAGKVRCPA